jgi:threonine synthase
VLSELTRRGEIDPDERVVLVITGDGLKTLDAVRGTFHIHEIDPTLDAFETAVASAVA